MKRVAVLGSTSILALAILGVATPALAGTVTSETHGPRTVRVFVPSKPVAPVSMIVMLHGCTQDPSGFADATGMDAVAEEAGFVVAYPEQPPSVTPTKCWQWWDPAHQERDAGEPKELADAATAIATAHGVDTARVYVAGISAGGAMSTILGATYPDRFTAVGVVAGLEYKAATSFGGVLDASSKGGPDPGEQGNLVFAGMGARSRVVPAIVFQGTADSVVAKANGDQVAAMWTRVATLALGAPAIDAPASVSAETGYPFTWSIARNKANGASIVEHFTVDGLGHAWPGGKSGGSYSDPKGPDASRLLWAFFKGRTRSAPLDVPAPVAPGSPPGSSSGSSSSSSSGATTEPGDPPSNTSASDDQGGCSMSAPAGGAPGGASWAALVVGAYALVRRSARSRSATREASRARARE